MKFIATATGLMLLVAGLCSCAGPTPNSKPAESRALISQMENSIANKLFDDAFNELLDRSPQQQSYLGFRESTTSGMTYLMTMPEKPSRSSSVSGAKFKGVWITSVWTKIQN